MFNQAYNKKQNILNRRTNYMTTISKEKKIVKLTTATECIVIGGLCNISPNNKRFYP